MSLFRGDPISKEIRQLNMDQNREGKAVKRSGHQPGSQEYQEALERTRARARRLAELHEEISD
jgi:hypothetical protein